MIKNSNIPSELPKYIDPNVDLQAIRQECEKLVKSRAKYSAGVAIIPIPLLDVVVDAGLLSVLLPEITAKFKLIDNPKDLDKLSSQDERTKEIKDRIFEFAGLVMTRGVVKNTIHGFGSRILTKQISKFIPFGGQLVSAGLGYMIFKKVAYDHIEECYQLASKIQQKG